MPPQTFTLSRAAESWSIIRLSTHMVSIGCWLLFLKYFFHHSKTVFPKKRVTTLGFITIFGMILQMWERERASCPSSVCLWELKGLWSGSLFESLLRELAKILPSLSSGKPQLLPEGRMAWSTSLDTQLMPVAMRLTALMVPPCAGGPAAFPSHSTSERPWPHFCCP